LASRASSDIYRVLDANLNRAREGLRVLEDTCRFILKDDVLFARLRRLRHGLDEASRKAYPKLISARDSQTDSGRRVKEKQKRPFAGLVIANFKRAQEALRVLEEYGKVLSPGAAVKLKAIRYGLYDAEKKYMSSTKGK
jgi:thiamine-phosphate pyrophosphorylase